MRWKDSINPTSLILAAINGNFRIYTIPDPHKEL